VNDRALVLEEMLHVALVAAAHVRERYEAWTTESDNAVEYKGIDDPVTALDREANALVCDALRERFPDVPIIAEESAAASWDVRKGARVAFFVDPIDGTKELIARNGEFAVMIGFAEAGAATAGVVACPASGRTFAGARGHGAFELKGGARRAISVRDVLAPSRARALVSRSRPDARTNAVLASVGIADVVPMGGAGLKASIVAAGEAQLYVHLAPAGKLWDACPCEAILSAAGGVLTDGRGRPIDYRGRLELDDGVIAGAPTAHHWVLAALAS
jgi:3'(2'), 5'-bisphosphate nucleotidase